MKTIIAATAFIVILIAAIIFYPRRSTTSDLASMRQVQLAVKMYVFDSENKHSVGKDAIPRSLQLLVEKGYLDQDFIDRYVIKRDIVFIPPASAEASKSVILRCVKSNKVAEMTLDGTISIKDE